MAELNIAEYERVMLEMALYAPSLIDQLDIQPFLFFSESRIAIFGALIDARRGGLKPDLIMVSDALARAGNGRYLTELVNLRQPSTTANARFYRDKLADYARKRELRRTVEDMRAAIEDVGVSADELADRALESISEAMQKTALRTSPVLASILPEYMDDINRRVMEARNRTATLMRTGFYNLDDAMGAILPGELVVVAARPACGKSVFAQHCALHISHTLSVPSALFSLEMEQSQILDRVLASQGVASVREMREGRLNDDALARLLPVCEIYRETPLAVYDSVYSTAQLHSYIRREVVNRGAKFVAVDYLGLLAGLSGDSVKARWERVGEESRYLKLLAKELKIVVMLLVQLNRDAEGIEPTMAMLRDSGSIEQDADKIVFLWSKMNDEDKNAEVRQIMVKIGKNRNGGIGQVPLMFDGPHVRMYVEVPTERHAPEGAWGDIGGVRR